MSDFITLSCPSCGGKLQITKDIERFACAHCGNEMIVNRGQGIISLKPVIDEVKGVRKAADHTASELAIVRLQNDIDYLNSQIILKNSILQYFLIVVGVLGLILSFLAVINDAPALCGWFSIGCVIIVIWNIVVIIKRSEVRKELEAELYAKRVELQKHQDIVNSN